MTMITDTQLTAMRRALEALEAKPRTRFSTPEVVEALALQIRRARDELGHDLTDIALLLQAHGLAIKPARLARLSAQAGDGGASAEDAQVAECGGTQGACRGGGGRPAGTRCGARR